MDICDLCVTVEHLHLHTQADIINSKIDNLLQFEPAECPCSIVQGVLFAVLIIGRYQSSKKKLRFIEWISTSGRSLHQVRQAEPTKAHADEKSNHWPFTKHKNNLPNRLWLLFSQVVSSLPSRVCSAHNKMGKKIIFEWKFFSFQRAINYRCTVNLLPSFMFAFILLCLYLCCAKVRHRERENQQQTLITSNTRPERVWSSRRKDCGGKKRREYNNFLYSAWAAGGKKSSQTPKIKLQSRKEEETASLKTN